MSILNRMLPAVVAGALWPCAIAQPTLISFLSAHIVDNEIVLELSAPLGEDWILERSTDGSNWAPVILPAPPSSNTIRVMLDVPEAFFRCYNAQIPELFSENGAGYVRREFSQGYHFIGNPFDNGRGNQIQDILTTSTVGSVVCKFDAAQQRWSSFSMWTTSGWASELTVLPGEGAICKTGPAVLISAGVFRPPLAVQVVPGWNLIGPLVTGGGYWDMVTSPFEPFPPDDGECVLKWNDLSQTYDPLYLFEFGDWGGREPHFSNGDGWWHRHGAGASDAPLTVLLDNRSVGAPMRDGLGYGLDGRIYGGQLYLELTPGQSSPVGSVLRFGTGDWAGYFQPVPEMLVPIPEATSGGSAQIRVWEADLFPTYEAALAGGGIIGISNPFPISKAPSSVPVTPLPLIGLQGLQAPPPPDPPSLTPPTDNRFEFSFQAPNTTTYTVDVSVDFTNWTELAFGTNRWSGLVTIEDSDAATAQRFYRVTLASP